MSEKRKSGSAGKKKPARETSAPVLQQAMMRRLPRLLRASADYRLPAVPSLLEHYVQMFNAVWTGVGRNFAADDLEQFRVALRENLARAWNTSQYSRVIVSFATEPPPQTSLSWGIDVEAVSTSDEYNHWVATRTPPLFGTHPDAKIFEVARELGAPADVTILDVGAGTGRNTLPLARAGFPTDAIELAPALAGILRDDVAKEGLSDRVRVFEGDALDPALGVPLGHYRLVVLAEVIASHARSVAQVGAML